MERANRSVRTTAQLVNDASRRIARLSPARVAAEVADAGALLVDLREQEERVDGGVIRGAVHAARGMLEFYADPTSPYHRPEFDPRRRTILHCDSGGRSALAAATLTRLGYQDLALLAGGFQAWKAQGGPVEPADAAPATPGGAGAAPDRAGDQRPAGGG